MTANGIIAKTEKTWMLHENKLWNQSKIIVLTTKINIFHAFGKFLGMKTPQYKNKEKKKWNAALYFKVFFIFLFLGKKLCISLELIDFTQMLLCLLNLKIFTSYSVAYKLGFVIRKISILNNFILKSAFKDALIKLCVVRI